MIVDSVTNFHREEASCPVDQRETLLRFGSVVRSLRGRDRKRLFVVLSVDVDRTVAPVSVANGLLHPMAKPKRKNPRHLELVGELTESEKSALNNAESDEILVQIIEKYDKNCK